MSRCVCIVLLLAAVSVPALATWAGPAGGQLLLRQENTEDLRAGRFYHEGTRVRIPVMGVSLVVPRDWRVRLPAGSRVAQMDSARVSGLGILLFLKETTPEELAERLSEPQAFEAAYVLEPIDEVEREGSRWSASYLHGDKFGTAVALLGPANQATVYLITGHVQRAAYYEALVGRLADSTRFMSQATARLLMDWYQRLSGMMLTRPTPSAEGRLEEWHLCSNGNFVYRVRPASPTADDPEARGFEESGRWRIDVDDAEARLVVIARRGLPRALALGYEPDLYGERTVRSCG